jgi:hypothetical protein
MNDNDPSPWSFSGYGTLGYSHQDNDLPNYFVRDLTQGVKSLRSGSWLPDSRVGLQAAYRFSPQTDAVVQAVVRDKTEATLGNSIEWAYLSHRPAPELNVRIGRLGIDVFLLSDYRNLGYAQTTVRPNWDFYGFMPIYSLDGIDANYSLNTDGARWNLKSQWGRSQAIVPVVGGMNYDFIVDDFRDITLVREAGPWRLKVGYAAMKVTNEAPLAALTGPLAEVAALPIPGVNSEAAGLLNNLRFKDGRISYLALGASYDDRTWLGQAEVSRVSGNRQIYPQGTAAYLSVGRRFGAFIPYAGVSGFRPAKNAATAIQDWASPLGVDAAVLQNMAVRGLNSTRIDQRTFSLGLRWEVHVQAAIKLQWDRIRINPNGYGLWSSSETAPLATDRSSLITATLDWVF